MTATPETHSPLGGSGAERWINCPGSVTDAELFFGEKHHVADAPEPEWTRRGTEAHNAAERCLRERLDAWLVLDDPEDADAVQVYLDYCRERMARAHGVGIEEQLHVASFHPLFRGKIDFFCVDDDWLEIVDYKHGEGVYVSEVDNSQLKYYAGLVLLTHARFIPLRVRLTICQPRAGGRAIRSWETTGADVIRWLSQVLRPAMDRYAEKDYEPTFKPGSWCRFCDKKVECPAMIDLAGRAIAGEVLDYGALEVLKMYVKAREAAAYADLMAGKDVPGAKLVKAKANRVWSDGADVPTKVVPCSPADVEKTGPKGKAFVKEWAYTPDTGYSVASISDPRAGIKPKSDEDTFAGFLTSLPKSGS